LYIKKKKKILPNFLKLNAVNNFNQTLVIV